MKKYNYLYVIINKINSKIYVGVHSTDKLNDYYFGSGVLLRKSIKKYGRENFQKQILMFFDSVKEMNETERAIVDEDFISRRDTYNMELGGSGGKIWNREMRKKMSDIQIDAYKSGKHTVKKGWKHSDETKKQMRKNHADVSGENNPMYGKSVESTMSSEQIIEYRKHISEGNTGKKRNSEHKKNYSDYAKKRFWIVNKEGKLCHAISKDDVRLKSGLWKLGKKWNKD